MESLRLRTSTCEITRTPDHFPGSKGPKSIEICLPPAKTRPDDQSGMTTISLKDSIRSMSNSYFKFKQFTIHQDKCAMKVCTDACIFGAWFARKNLSAKNILDVGSGTGLLLLMLAQQQDGQLEGIEIDSSSFEQMKENVEKSKWKNRISVHHGDIRNLKSNIKYDFIISNPPFHENSLSSTSRTSNLARHSSELKLEELIVDIDRLLNDEGTFAVLLPYYRTAYFEELANERNFLPVEKILVKQSPNHKYFRSILSYSRTPIGKPTQKELTIENESREYTNEFMELLKDYYLYLQPD